MNEHEAVAGLMQLRALTGMTGQIYSAQVKQLEYWPLLAVPHAKRSEVTFETNEEGGDRRVYVAFTVDSRKKAPKNVQRRLKILEKNIQWLLGNSWKVIVSFGGKIVYRGTRKVEPRPQPKPEPRRGRRK